MDDPNNQKEIEYNNLYPKLVGGVALFGPIFSNFTTLILINLIGSDNPMAIPYVCMLRQLMAIPAIYGLFLMNKNFWYSIGGFYIRQIFTLGYTAPTILML